MSEIKTIIPHTCPNCSKPIFLELELPMPITVGTISQDDVNNAKKSVIEQISLLGNLSDEAREEAIAWVNDEATIFGPSYVETIINDLLNR